MHTKTASLASKLAATVAFTASATMTMTASADQQILDDLIVDGSACVGQDCVNGESFGFDTIRLKENNLRIKFLDTSVSASFRRTTGSSPPTTRTMGVQTGFRSTMSLVGVRRLRSKPEHATHALYVDDGGRIGIGTNRQWPTCTSKPAIRQRCGLEQDGSSGIDASDVGTWRVTRPTSSSATRQTAVRCRFGSFPRRPATVWLSRRRAKSASV